MSVVRIEVHSDDPDRWALEVSMRADARTKRNAEELLALYPWWRFATRAKLRRRIAELSERIYETGLALAARGGS